MLSRLLYGLFLWVAAAAVAGESFWTNENGGEFWEPTNWSPAVPGVSDTAQFTNRGTYTIRFSNSPSNSDALFHRGTVTQDLAGASWFLTNAFRVGESAGETSRVVVASGSLVVTNSTRNAMIEAGRLGTGEFAIAGGHVTVDSLLATNRARSLLRFGHGDLTLLNGGEINLGAKLFLGSGVSNVFTWNLLGGTTRIVDQPFAYGTLTLGGSSRAVLNLDGSSTFLKGVSPAQ